MVFYYRKTTAQPIDNNQTCMKEMDSASVGFEPASILAYQDLRATNVATSSLPKELGHLVKVNQRGYSTS